MAEHLIKRVQKIPVPIDKVWDFFSDPRNLQAITPGDVHFKILTTDLPAEMRQGQLIDYYIKPFAGFRFFWRTEITYVRKKEYFEDVQLKGPYKLWRHEHFFKEIPGGVEMTDVVHYKAPLGILGQMANAIYLRNKLRKIFEYRFLKVESLFGKWPVTGENPK